MTGLASAWAMARERPKENRYKVDVATRRSAAHPTNCNTLLGRGGIVFLYKNMANLLVG